MPSCVHQAATATEYRCDVQVQQVVLATLTLTSSMGDDRAAAMAPLVVPANTC